MLSSMTAMPWSCYISWWPWHDLTTIISWRVRITMIVPCHSMIAVFHHGRQHGQLSIWAEFIVSCHIYNMERKIINSTWIFLRLVKWKCPTPDEWPDFWFIRTLDHWINAFLLPNATKIIRSSNYVQNSNYRFFWRKKGFLLSLNKIGKSDKFGVECASIDTISWKWFFHFNFEVFYANKSENFQVN